MYVDWNISMENIYPNSLSLVTPLLAPIVWSWTGIRQSILKFANAFLSRSKNKKKLYF